MAGETNSSSRTAEDFKRSAATWAAAQLKDGLVVGLGSGSTATFAVAAIGQLVKSGLRIVGIPTSEKTAAQARTLGIPLATFADYAEIDVTIDGADEVELRTLNLIKGGGGNLLREKIVASSSARLVIVVDQSKLVEGLGSHFSVPVEVARFGWQSTARRLKALGAAPVLRMDADEKTFVTDGGNCILDCAFGVIESPAQLQTQLDSTVGVVEHGLFIGLTSQVVVGGPGGVKTLDQS